MPLRLTDELNELKVHDNISGSDIVLYYRNPTTAENVRYTNSLVVREKNKLVNRTGETRMKFGAEILMGIRDGDFERKIGGKYLPLSSTPGSENYDSTWKDQVIQYASYLIELLAVHVFERPAVEEEGEEEDGPEKN